MRTETTRQAIYAERPAEMGYGVGNVAASIRIIEKYQARPEDASRTMGSRPLEGATILSAPGSATCR